MLVANTTSYATYNKLPTKLVRVGFTDRRSIKGYRYFVVDMAEFGVNVSRDILKQFMGNVLKHRVWVYRLVLRLLQNCLSTKTRL